MPSLPYCTPQKVASIVEEYNKSHPAPGKDTRIPDATEADEGKVLGVNEEGEYTLVEGGEGSGLPDIDPDVQSFLVTDADEAIWLNWEDLYQFVNTTSRIVLTYDWDTGALYCESQDFSKMEGGAIVKIGQGKAFLGYYYADDVIFDFNSEAPEESTLSITFSKFHNAIDFSYNDKFQCLVSEEGAFSPEAFLDCKIAPLPALPEDALEKDYVLRSSYGILEWVEPEPTVPPLPENPSNTYVLKVINGEMVWVQEGVN